MRKLILLLLLLNGMSGIGIKAQSITLSSGGEIKTNTTSISYSIGQLLTAPSTGGQFTIWPGAQQPNLLTLTSLTPQDPNLVIISTYPNPVTSELNVEINSDKTEMPWEAIIYNAWGSALIKTPIYRQEKINLNHLPAGIYLLMVHDRHTGMRYKHKIIKPA